MSQVKFGKITKALNSTSRVINGGAISLDCKLVEPCSLHSPIFIVKGLNKTPTHEYNYAIWNPDNSLDDSHAMYYWIKDVVYVTNDIQHVYCELDPLATYRHKILEVRALVQYSDEDHWNKKIDDVRFNPEVESPANSVGYSYETNIDDLVFGLDVDNSGTFQGGTVIMRVVDASSTDSGVKTYAMTQTQFSKLLSELYNSTSGATIDKIIGLIGGTCAWIDNIVSCIWVPFKIDSSEVKHTWSRINIGAVPCPTTAGSIGDIYEIDPILIETDIAARKRIDLSWDIFETDEREFLKNERWSVIQIVTPFGYTTIPVDDLVLQKYLWHTTAINKSTGDVVINFTENFDGDGQVFATFSGNLSVDLMSLLGNGYGYGASQTESVYRGVKTGVAIGETILSHGALAAQAKRDIESAYLDMQVARAKGKEFGSTWDKYENAAARYDNSIASTGIDAIAQSIPSSRSVGCASGKLSCGPLGLWTRKPFGSGKLIRKTYIPSDIANYKSFCGLYGYPCNRFLTVGDCDGYIKCSGANIRNPDGATPNEIATINSYLNNGIIIAE